MLQFCSSRLLWVNVAHSCSQTKFRLVSQLADGKHNNNLFLTVGHRSIFQGPRSESTQCSAINVATTWFSKDNDPVLHHKKLTPQEGTDASPLPMTLVFVFSCLHTKLEKFEFGTVNLTSLTHFSACNIFLSVHNFHA